MTLHDESSPDTAARTIELLNAADAAEGDDDEAWSEIVAEVLRRWHETPDDGLRKQSGAVRGVVGQLDELMTISDVDEAARVLNRMLAAHAGPPELVKEPGWGWHIHVDRADAGWAAWLAASSAFGFAVLLALHGRVVWGRCASTDCRRAFIDRGRRDPQRYCSTTCATRERVRRHRSAPSANTAPVDDRPSASSARIEADD